MFKYLMISRLKIVAPLLFTLFNWYTSVKGVNSFSLFIIDPTVNRF